LTSDKESVLLQEARWILGEAQNRNITLRLLGAIAFRLRCEGKLSSNSAVRPLTDVDFMAYSEQRGAIRKMMEDLGLTLDESVLMDSWGSRYVFHDKTKNITVDVFFDKLDMCHAIDLRKGRRLELEKETLAPADLLLEKMQIVHLEKKDIVDTVSLMVTHNLGNDDHDRIDMSYISRLLSNDWGFYYTVTSNLRKIQEVLPDLGFLTEIERRTVASHIMTMIAQIDVQPKTVRWMMRSKVGTKRQWYKDVEEKTRGRV
jgi:DNA-directed RNA polymerase subunit N (RpoN/RPB10)